jgi:hypothetical protein
MQGVIKKKYGQDATNVGDEGGFAPNIQVSILLCPFVPLCCLHLHVQSTSEWCSSWHTKNKLANVPLKFNN